MMLSVVCVLTPESSPSLCYLYEEPLAEEEEIEHDWITERKSLSTCDEP